MELLILWEHCSHHPDLENGHCFMLDTNEGDGSFTFKAVGLTCVLKVAKGGTHSELAERLSKMFDKDTAIDEVRV